MPVCELESRRDLEQLKSAVRLFNRPAAFRVIFNCPSTLTGNRKRRLERRLAFALSDCGCAPASLMLVLVPSSLYFVFDYPLSADWRNWTVYIAGTLAGAVLAKLAGLTLSFCLARRSLREMLKSVSPG